ncbi:MAG: hypothetical protein K2P84_13510 [Undibacterium sp.]|nr:hypothetical protein [Undibacterium sp.]
MINKLRLAERFKSPLAPLFQRGELGSAYFLVLLGLVLVALFYWWRCVSLEGQLVQIKTQHKQEVAAADSAAAKRVLEANDRADVLFVQLSHTEQTLKTLSQEKQHAIVNHTTGRTCFNAPLVRVLNATTRSQTSSLPASSPVLDAGDDAVATDTDLAPWIVNAQEQYEVCRARLKVLIDWHTSEKEVHEH